MEKVQHFHLVYPLLNKRNLFFLGHLMKIQFTIYIILNFSFNIKLILERNTKSLNILFVIENILDLLHN